jgi:hypothetical protein
MATIILFTKFSKQFLFILGFFCFFSCKNGDQNYYRNITTELAANNIHVHTDKNIFVIMVGKSECLHCNVQFAAILNDTNITKHFPMQNICFVMPFIRNVERKSYEESLSSYLQYKPIPTFIYNQRIYDALENNLKNAVSGFFIIEPTGTIKLCTGLNDTHIYDAIIEKL